MKGCLLAGGSSACLRNSAEDFVHYLQRIASAPAEQQAADSAAAEEAEKVVTPLRALW